MTPADWKFARMVALWLVVIALLTPWAVRFFVSYVAWVESQ